MHSDQKQAQALLILRNVVANFVRLETRIKKLLTGSRRANCSKVLVHDQMGNRYQPEPDPSTVGYAGTQAPWQLIGETEMIYVLWCKCRICCCVRTHQESTITFRDCHGRT